MMAWDEGLELVPILLLASGDRHVPGDQIASLAAFCRTDLVPKQGCDRVNLQDLQEFVLSRYLTACSSPDSHLQSEVHLYGEASGLAHSFAWQPKERAEFGTHDCF